MMEQTMKRLELGFLLSGLALLTLATYAYAKGVWPVSMLALGAALFGGVEAVDTKPGKLLVILAGIPLTLLLAIKVTYFALYIYLSLTM